MGRVSTLSALPAAFLAGTTVKYTRSLADYPATGGWTLKLALAGPAAFSKDAAASGADHAVELTATDTVLAPGVYQWSEQVRNGAGVIYEVASGTVVIRANPGSATGASQQSWAEKTLAVVEAAIAGTLAGGLQSYQIHGRAVNRIPLEDLLKLRNTLRAQVAREQYGAEPMSSVRIRFSGTENE